MTEPNLRVPPIRVTARPLVRSPVEVRSVNASEESPRQVVYPGVHPGPQGPGQSTGGMSMILALLFLIGVALTIAPLYFYFHGDIGFVSMAVPVVIGLATLIIVAAVVMFTRLYRRAAANLAFVRTGSGGAKVIKDTG